MQEYGIWRAIPPQGPKLKNREEFREALIKKEGEGKKERKGKRCVKKGKKREKM